MNCDLVALLSFILITTFTPGPNNITSASMGLNFGYKSSLRFLCGVFTGFVVIMILCALTSVTLINLFPDIEKIMSLVGSLYIMWLAYHTLKANYNFDEQDQKILGFSNGFFLQILNPKVIIYGITIYSTFLGDMPRNSILLPLSSLIFAGFSFCSISLWTSFGYAIRKYMKHKRIKILINTAFSFLLFLTALKISGILALSQLI